MPTWRRTFASGLAAAANGGGAARSGPLPGDIYLLFGFSSAVFWYGGWPFLEVKS